MLTPENLQQQLARYLSGLLAGRDELQLELKYYQQLGNWNHVVTDATHKCRFWNETAWSTNDHQDRREWLACAKFEVAILSRENEVKQAPSFDVLYHLLWDIKRQGNVEGVGALFIYDVALRIGVYLNLAPERLYVTRGARDGARQAGFFLDPGPVELPPTGQAQDGYAIFDRDTLVATHPDLAQVSMTDLEHFLCIAAKAT